MLDRLTEIFCAVDDFCQALEKQRKAHLIGIGAAAWAGTRSIRQRKHHAFVVLHSSRFKYLKNLDNGFAMPFLHQCFPSMSCYEQFVTVHKRAFVLLIFLHAQPSGHKDRHLLHRQHIPAGVR